ncbi:DJ-1/PfpI family protein [Candidatus Pacearchaeota archaeon]|nr:DJ-1/PfpI family protein [Candidatus Pacearchaeota archaeon]HLC87286.1 DJ-1/PfpI family protein [Candidatus Nanoarchaeia archaeon]
MEQKRVLMVIASSNFRDEELLIPKRFFESKNIKVTVASTRKEKIRGMLGAVSTPDITLNEVSIHEYDAVIFVGGSGIDKNRFYENKDCLNIAKASAFRGKATAAICLGVKILANADLLRARKATCYETAIEYIKDKGAIYTQKDVVQDINLITANGPEAAQEFAEKILNYINKK